jgi:hypothetical protein
VTAKITRSQNSSHCTRPASRPRTYTIRGEDHAVAAARLDGHWLTLDNRRMAMVEDAYIRNYRPMYVIDQYGVMQYVDAPVLAVAPDWEPSAALKLAAEPDLISSSNWLKLCYILIG